MNYGISSMKIQSNIVLSRIYLAHFLLYGISNEVNKLTDRYYQSLKRLLILPISTTGDAFIKRIFKSA